MDANRFIAAIRSSGEEDASERNVFAIDSPYPFTSSSDIDWSKPIPEIDQQIYKKYGLSDEEIEFIETHVKEMN